MQRERSTQGTEVLTSALAPASIPEPGRSGSGRGSLPVQARQTGIAATGSVRGTHSASQPRPAHPNFNARSQSLVWKRPVQQQQSGSSVTVTLPTTLNSQPQVPVLPPQQQRAFPPRIPAIVHRTNLNHHTSATSGQAGQALRPASSKNNTWVLGQTLIPNHQLPQPIPPVSKSLPAPQQRFTVKRVAQSVHVIATKTMAAALPNKHQSLTWRMQPGGPPTNTQSSTASLAIKTLHVPAPISTHGCAFSRTHIQIQRPHTLAQIDPSTDPAGITSSTQAAPGYVKRSANKLQLLPARRRSLPAPQHPAPNNPIIKQHKASRHAAEAEALRPNVWKRVELSVAPRTFKLRLQQNAVLTKLRRHLSTSALQQRDSKLRSNVWKQEAASLLGAAPMLQPPVTAQQPTTQHPRSTWIRGNSPSTAGSKANLVLKQLSSLRTRPAAHNHSSKLHPLLKRRNKLTANKLVRVDGELQRVSPQKPTRTAPRTFSLNNLPTPPLSPQPARHAPRRTFVLHKQPRSQTLPSSPLSKPSSSAVCVPAKSASTRGPARKAIVLFANAWRRRSGLLPSTGAVGLPSSTRVVSAAVKRQRMLRMAHERSLANAHRHFSISSRKRPFCSMFCRSGACAEHEQGKCRNVHDATKVAVCVMWLQGRCASLECKMQHSLQPDLMPICGFFLKGLCSKDQCPFLHINYAPDTPVCRDFLLGHCSAGQSCSKQHLTIKMAKEVVQKKRARTAEVEKERLEKLARCDESSVATTAANPVFDLGSLDLML